MSEQLTIIDKVLDIKIQPSKYNNEYSALGHLKEGMLALYNIVKPIELNIEEAAKARGKKILYVGADMSGLSVPPELDRMLPCIFHWFGNSLINYARLNGYIVACEQGQINQPEAGVKQDLKKISGACTNYVKALPEIREVLKWRHKVSAHFALTDPRQDDNVATLGASIIYPVGFVDLRFRTGSLILMQSHEEEVHESEIPRWSLTEVFESLADRFWPDIQFHS